MCYIISLYTDLFVVVQSFCLLITHQDESYITRWRGKQYGYVDHPVKYDDYRNIWLEKEGKWISGKIYKDAVYWQEPQGTGIKAGKVLGHELRLKDEFSIDDK